MNTYLATLYSKSVDQFDYDCNNEIFSEHDLVFWIRHLPDHYNKAYKVEDFEIISIVKIGE